MALVNQVQDMKSQGMNEENIIKKLRDAGYSPLEISRTLEQSKIKDAVSQLGSDLSEQSGEGNMTSEMRPSVMEAPGQQEQQPQNYEQYAPEPQQEQQPQYYYPQEQQYQQYQSTNTENLTEVTEQIVEEKIDEMRKKILEVNSFKIISERRMKDLDDRLKKIELFIQELEIKILGKVGDYGESLNDIKQEMTMMQDSFSKVINPLVDRVQISPKEQVWKQPKETITKKRKK
jgi:hypothetical protein